MSGSSRRRQQIAEALALEEAKEVESAITSVIEKAREASEVVSRTPAEFVKGRLDRAWHSGEALRKAWADADSGDRALLVATIGKIAREIEQDVNSLHSDAAPSEAKFDDATTAILSHVRSRANLPESFPLTLVADHFENAINT